MTMQTFKLYLTKGVGRYIHGEIGIQDFALAPSCAADPGWGKVLLKEFQVKIDVPESDTRQAEIDAIEAAIQKERAESQSRVDIMLDRISKLKAITHDGGDE